MDVITVMTPTFSFFINSFECIDFHRVKRLSVAACIQHPKCESHWRDRSIPIIKKSFILALSILSLTLSACQEDFAVNDV